MNLDDLRIEKMFHLIICSAFISQTFFSVGGFYRFKNITLLEKHQLPTNLPMEK